MTSQPAFSASSERPAISAGCPDGATKRQIDERVANWTDGELQLHQRLNRSEQAPGIYGDMPDVLAMLQYEVAAIEQELRRRGVEGTA